tara:strand:- start:1996 stop:3027 length:1032 start_codon:yes stop_codon:yes gene_type:complete
MKLSVNADITKAKSIDSSFYKEEQYFKLCINKIFRKSWQLTCHQSEFLNNNIYPFYFLKGSINEPLIITKLEGESNCLSNVCTHRGHIINERKCNRKKMMCGYHGRTFNLNGEIDKMPGFEGVKNFPTAKDNLISFPILNWNDFTFTAIEPSINIKDILDDISNRLPDYPFNKISYSEKYSNTYHLNANWALYCENYLEGLHVPFVHRGLASEINMTSYKTEILNNGVLQYTDSNTDEAYAHYYWIFPNIMLNFYRWGLSVNIVEPISTNQTKIKFLSYPIKNFKNINKKIQELHNVEMEDEKVVLNVQKGIQSEFYKNGRYSANYEKGTHYFHRLICKYINQ